MELYRPRVLVVDDNLEAQETMRAYLEDVVYVTTAGSGRQAIEYVQDHKVDVILLDVDMPIMDGFLTLENLRKQINCVNVPVIFVTGMRDRHTVMNSLMVGSDGYLLKPVEKQMLREKVLQMYERGQKKKNKKTILAIDDDMAFLKLVDSYLRDTYNVVIINSGKLALNYLMKHTPDLILLDYQMPLYSGANLMSMFPKKEENANIPVIILSGAIDMDALKDLYAYKPAAVLAKPVTKETLLENLDKILTREEN
ncbi:MAG: response regulator [Lachnospiraceae bacterium]|nr:response regulator [Lachnospiraceae bacterium]